MSDLIKSFRKELQEYKDYLLFCYDNGIINGEQFYNKMDWVSRLEKL